MSSPSVTLNRTDWQFKSTAEIKPSSSASVAATIRSFKYDNENRDHKLADYLLLGVLSIFVHTTVVSHFDSSSLEQKIITPAKQPSKVEISFTKPKPKPIVIPPPPPPPVAQVKQPTIPKKAPPPKAAAPKPVAHNAVPLKPQATKSVERVAEPIPTFEPTPVIQSTVPVSTTPAPAAPAAPPAPVVSEKVTAPTAGADYLNNPEPEYPDIAMDNGWEGKVLMKVHVQPDGKPDTITVSKSSGQKVLDDAAVKTVHKWSFVPAMRGDTPVAGWVTVPITFNLS
ncbi:MAG: energy transducer TonB [Methylococcaceae bacterium]